MSDYQQTASFSANTITDESAELNKTALWQISGERDFSENDLAKLKMNAEFFKTRDINFEPPNKIAVFRALMLGDLLVAVPAFRALRRAFPRAEITLIGLPWARAFAERFSQYFDSFLEFPGFPGLPEIEPDVRRFPPFLLAAQRRKFDLAIQLHGSGSYVNSLVALFGARVSAGFFAAGEWLPDARTFLEYPETETEIRRNLRLLEFLGIAPEFLDDELEFPLTEKDRADFSYLAAAHNLNESDFVCLHAGARFESRRWHPEKFAAVADALAEKGWRIVLTGTKSETDLARAVGSRMTADFVDLTGKTSLGALGVLLKRAKLLISNDTGISHIAAALKTPSVVVVLGSDAARWQAYNRRFHRVVLQPVECRPCGFEVCPIGHLCAEKVTTEMVLAESLTLLENRRREKLILSARGESATAAVC